ncbi:MAG TPA: NHL repeat-containing protein [Pyrinomonadaceae bacterium]|nr:NHL repeat-containing protein [Pyrinomonadaceae bacterium]
MPRTFDCPKCGAPVGYAQSTSGGEFTVRCSYCNSTLAQPNEALGRPAQVIRVDLRGATQHLKPLRWLWILLLIPALGLLAGGIALFVGLMPLFRTSSNGNTSTPASRTSPRRDERVLLKFGSEGIGPGMFKDARSIAVDASGNIYVGEYIGGRVQVFDGTGKFISQWNVDPNAPLRGFAADRKGTVYIAQKGRILRYEGATGKELKEVAYAEGNGFDDITATPDGGLVCGWQRNRDDLVRFNSSGEVVNTIKAAVSSASGKSELNMRVASDGLGNIYALGTFNDAVFKFGPDGKFINRFGGSGSEPGQFRAASAIAVDGRGRVYVSDIKGIQVFDADGRYLNSLKLEGHAFGMVFNDKNELFVAARTQVIKLNVAD